ncbi:Hint domain-containing protein [Oceaniglobus indicus]|uniref:Hint domain-containing protein n=1 Tax=Oceaniglobus indicus TaxID=2047749 RepID=UPI000C18FF02|nr:Hint domain-containing protein [Oceaniglobus indicus]
MPQEYVDQFYRMDPGNPPAFGTTLSVERLVFTDVNDNGVIRGNTGDTFDGSRITAVYVNDTVTIRPSDGGPDITYTGTTFYTANGARAFTPRGNAVLEEGTFVRSTYVNYSTQISVNQFGPTCFGPGTKIATVWGAMAIEEIREGTLVQTADNGLQPVRLVISRAETGVGRCAPVEILGGALGDHGTLRLSQQHRVLQGGWRAELFLGASEVLIAAKHMVGRPGIALAPCRSIVYRHLLFDAHQVVFAEGLPVESFNPGDAVLDADPALAADVTNALSETSARQLTMRAVARPVVRAAEAAVLA